MRWSLKNPPQLVFCHFLCSAQDSSTGFFQARFLRYAGPLFSLCVKGNPWSFCSCDVFCCLGTTEQSLEPKKTWKITGIFWISPCSGLLTVHSENCAMCCNKVTGCHIALDAHTVNLYAEFCHLLRGINLDSFVFQRSLPFLSILASENRRQRQSLSLAPANGRPI